MPKPAVHVALEKGDLAALEAVLRAKPDEVERRNVVSLQQIGNELLSHRGYFVS